ncbi:MAG: 50S ribosomal protein L6 [bacterium]|nr:50S ribosomal protein L6 [bacterium]
MSRIGKSRIELPLDASLVVQGSMVEVNGPKGQLRLDLPPFISIQQEGSVVEVVTTGQGKDENALHGFVRALLANHIKGVTSGWERILELSGVGYRAALSGSALELSVGFSHPIRINPPPGITFEIKEGKISVFGIDKQVVGQTAAHIRAVKKPEPYKGKGIRYQGEHVRKKAGKAAKAVGSASSSK